MCDILVNSSLTLFFTKNSVFFLAVYFDGDNNFSFTLYSNTVESNRILFDVPFHRHELPYHNYLLFYFTTQTYYIKSNCSLNNYTKYSILIQCTEIHV